MGKGNIIIKEDVAEAIEEYMDDIMRVMKKDEETGKGILVAEHCGQDWKNYENGQYSALNDISTFDLMRALVNGYIVVGRVYETKSPVKDETKAVCSVCQRTTNEIFAPYQCANCKISEVTNTLTKTEEEKKAIEKNLSQATERLKKEREDNYDLVKYRVAFRTLVEEMTAQKRRL